MIAKSDAASIFRDTRGSRSIEISVPGASTAVGFFGQQKNPGASAAERGRPSLFKTIDEDRRQRHDRINRSDRSTYPGRISVLTKGAIPQGASRSKRALYSVWRVAAGLTTRRPHRTGHGELHHPAPSGRLSQQVRIEIMDDP